MAKIQNINKKCWQRCGTTGAFIHAGGNAEWYSTLEESLAVSYKTKHTLTIRSSRYSNHSPCYLPKGVENLHPHKTLHMDV